MAIVLWIGKAGSLSSSAPSTLMGLPLSRAGCPHRLVGILHITYGACGSGGLARRVQSWFFCFLPALPSPPFEAVLMSKDVKSLPGEGRRGGPAAGLAKLSARSQSLCYLGVGVV